VPGLAILAHDEVAIVALPAHAALIALLRIRVVAVLTEALSVLEPVAIAQLLHMGQLFFAEVALDALFAGEFSSLVHAFRAHFGLQTLSMDALIAQFALVVNRSIVCGLFTLLACSALQAVPHEALDQVCMQVHAPTVNHHVAIGALQ